MIKQKKEEDKQLVTLFLDFIFIRKQQLWYR